MEQMNITDSTETLERISRHETGQGRETWSVASAGSQPLPLPIKIVSNVSYNVYNVEVVEVGSAGSLPTAISLETEATNMGEAFQSQGQLPAGTYSIMFRAGDKNVFYAKV